MRGETENMDNIGTHTEKDGGAEKTEEAEKTQRYRGMVKKGKLQEK